MKIRKRSHEVYERGALRVTLSMGTRLSPEMIRQVRLSIKRSKLGVGPPARLLRGVL